MQLQILSYKYNIADILGCIQKLPDWPPEARTANGTALCRYMQLYCYFVSQYSEFCHHNPFFFFASQRVFIVVSVYFVIDSVRKLLDIPSYYVKR
jgi:hypothetical protein